MQEPGARVELQSSPVIEPRVAPIAAALKDRLHMLGVELRRGRGWWSVGYRVGAARDEHGCSQRSNGKREDEGATGNEILNHAQKQCRSYDSIA
jgi:hypothetical protein